MKKLKNGVFAILKNNVVRFLKFNYEKMQMEHFASYVSPYFEDLKWELENSDCYRN